MYRSSFGDCRSLYFLQHYTQVRKQLECRLTKKLARQCHVSSSHGMTYRSTRLHFNPYVLLQQPLFELICQLTCHKPPRTHHWAQILLSERPNDWALLPNHLSMLEKFSFTDLQKTKLNYSEKLWTMSLLEQCLWYIQWYVYLIVDSEVKSTGTENLLSLRLYTEWIAKLSANGIKGWKWWNGRKQSITILCRMAAGDKCLKQGTNFLSKFLF